MWKDNRRRHSERTRTWDLLHKYGHDYKVIFVGDATMSPYEILQPGGSVEYFNEEAGAVWVKRFTDIYSKCVWLNPEPEEVWPYRQSIQIVKELMNNRMYPTTIAGPRAGDEGAREVASPVPEVRCSCNTARSLLLAALGGRSRCRPSPRAARSRR